MVTLVVSCRNMQPNGCNLLNNAQWPIFAYYAQRRNQFDLSTGARFGDNAGIPRAAKYLHFSRRYS